MHARLLVPILAVLLLASPSLAQPIAGGSCRPVAERTQDIGCWILTNAAVGALTGTQTFWHLDAYSTRERAEAAKSEHGTVLEALGKIWLLTIQAQDWRAVGGEHVATIGPL